MNFSGFVPLRRGLLEHMRTGRLTNAEALVLIVLILLADKETGGYTINAPALRSFLPELSYPAAKRILKSLEDKGYIWRKITPHDKVVYPYLVNNYEPTSGSHKAFRLSLSQVTQTNNEKDIRYVKPVPEREPHPEPHAVPEGEPHPVPNNNKEKDIYREKENPPRDSSGRDKRRDQESDKRQSNGLAHSAVNATSADVSMNAPLGEPLDAPLNAPTKVIKKTNNQLFADSSAPPESLPGLEYRNRRYYKSNGEEAPEWIVNNGLAALREVNKRQS